MAIFLYCLAGVIMLLLCPIFASAQGYFCLDKNSLLLHVKVYGIKVVTVRVLTGQNGIEYSINGKRAKSLGTKKTSGKKLPFKVSADAFYFEDISLYLYAGDDTLASSYICGGVLALFDGLNTFLLQRGLLKRAKVKVYPCYIREQGMAMISIKLHTSPIKFLCNLSHTKNEVNYAK